MGDLDKTISQDWFSCWPLAGKADARTSLTTVQVLGLEMGIPSDWKRDPLSNRFRERFTGGNGAAIVVTRQRSLTDKDQLLSKIERRELGVPWQGSSCHKDLIAAYSSLRDVHISSYRSSLYHRGWKTTVLLLFKDREDWVTVRVQQRWKKWKKRLPLNLIDDVFASIRTGDTLLLSSHLPFEEHPR